MQSECSPSRRSDLSTRDQAIEALQAPALDEGVAWSDEALNSVLDMTECFPYFLQQFGEQAWDIADGPLSITVSDVERSIPVVTAQLDDGFFRVGQVQPPIASGPTYERWRSLVRARSARLTSRRRSARSLKGVGPVRDALIKRGLCYSPHYGEIAFTVPLFDEYMKRWIPALPGP